MKRTILSLVAAFAAVSILQAHCGTCSTGGEKGEHAKGSSCANEQLAGYFSVQEALAADDLDGAKKGALAFLEHAGTLACSKGEGSCCGIELEAAETVSGSGDIAAAREAFKLWSDVLLEKVEKSGLSGDVAFKMHCPMAFGNKGASWLQAAKDLRNPYFGAMMLTCGMNTESYGGDTAASSCCGSGGECCGDKESCKDGESCGAEGKSCSETEGHGHSH